MKDKIKIITYGLRYSDYAKQRDLFAMRNNGEIDIMAEIAYEPEDLDIFYKRRSVDEGLKCIYDMIIVCSGTIDEARENIRNSGFNADVIRFEDISILTEPHYARVRNKQISILRDIVNASEDMIMNQEWLRRRLFDYGFFPFFKLAKEPQQGVMWSTVGILQVPDEFVDFCRFLLDYRFDSAIEIGVAAGASSYIMAALMYRKNPDMIYHMVDINDHLYEFDKIKEIIPTLQKEIPKTSNDFSGETYDFCFIDADHSYDGMMTDWENVGRYAKKLAIFHDIYAHEYDEYNGGTVRGWQKIKETIGKGNIREFSKFPKKWMGIGIIEH